MTTGAHANSHLGIVVGFDGSPHSIDALRWAADTATLHGSSLTVVAAAKFPYGDYIRGMSGSAFEDPSEQMAEEKLSEAQRILEAAQYQGDAAYRAEVGDATDVLVRLSADADLIVVGRRGLGRFWGQLLGSVASAVPPHSHCPTVIVYSSDDEKASDADAPSTADLAKRPVCVGVDSSENARMAAVAAAREASLRGVRLELVYAQPYFSSTATDWYWSLDEQMEQQLQSNMRQLLENESNFIKEHVPDVEISPVIVRKYPSEAMAECTRRAQLTVVGTRGHGGFARLLLGSVSRATLSNADGTVMIIPSDKNM